MAGGMDSGREAHLIDPDQAAGLKNIVCRGGSPGTRPAIVKLPATFHTFSSYDVNGLYEESPPSGPITEDVFKGGLFQGVGYFSNEGQQCLIASIGGRFLKVTPNKANCDVNELTIARRNNSTLPIAYMVQADRYFIIQDGESRPVIFDGATLRRSNTSEVPVGTIMAYGMGRIVVVRPNGEIIFGDIYNGKLNLGLDVLGFTETTFLNEGGSTALPPAMGRPTAARFYPQQDTSSGQGELIIYGESGAESFFLSLPREQWKDANFQREALIGIGAYGHRNVIDVNGDQWFRSNDGDRSYRQARAQVNQWSQIPLSTPVRKYRDVETAWLLQFGSSIHFDNRRISTATPIYNGGRVYHEGFLSLDFDILSAFGKEFEPAWDGFSYSEDFKVLQVVKGVFDGQERAFAFCIDENDENALYEITGTGIDDATGPIPWEIVTRRFDFQNPLELRNLLGGDLWISDVVSNDGVEVDVWFRSDEQEEWIHWHSFTAIPQNGAFGVLNHGIPTAMPGQAPRKQLPTPPDVCNAETKRNARLGYNHQIKINGIGHCRITKFRLHAQKVVENSKGDCA